MIAVDTSKDVIYSRLKIAEGPGAIHCQAGLCDSEFFAQLTSEVPSRRWKNGKALSGMGSEDRREERGLGLSELRPRRKDVPPVQ